MRRPAASADAAGPSLVPAPMTTPNTPRTPDEERRKTPREAPVTSSATPWTRYALIAVGIAAVAALVVAFF